MRDADPPTEDNTHTSLEAVTGPSSHVYSTLTVMEKAGKNIVVNPPPPSYQGFVQPTPGVVYSQQPAVPDAIYPAPPNYSAAVVQPGVMAMQPMVVQSTPVIQTQPVVTVVNPVVVNPNLTEHPTQLTCCYCQTQILTDTKYTNGFLVWILFGVLLIVGCWPCCLIPFCVPSCQDVQHRCPQCKNVIHTYKRM